MDKIKKIIANKYFIFTFAFLLMFVILLPYKDLISSSGDAVETWNVVKTFFASNKYTSYVMYKGVYAFLPGVMCYQLGNLISVDPFLIMKIFHALSFAYITVVGLPFIIKSIFKKDAKPYQKYLFILLLALLESNLFVFISVDFMSLALLLLCTNTVIKIKNNENTKKPFILYSGFILGVCTCLSGQYMPSAGLLIIYMIYLMIKRYKPDVKKIIIILCIFIVGIVGAKSIDKLYVKNVVDPARDSGAWIPSGMTWVKTGFTASMQYINYPQTLPDNLGGNMILSENMDTNVIKNGGYLYEVKGMAKMILKYPILFIARWSERVFLGILNDPFNSYPGRSPFSEILTIIIYGTLIYVMLGELKNNIKKVKDVFSLKVLICLNFILPSIVPSVMGHVENRYYFGIRAFMIAVFALSPFIPDTIKKLKKFKLKDVLNYKLSYNLARYFIFMLLIVLLYIAIYQSAGPNATMTYEIFK